MRRSDRRAPVGRARIWPEPERDAGLRLNEYVEAARDVRVERPRGLVSGALQGRLAPGLGCRRSCGRADRAPPRVRRRLRLLHPIVPFVTEALWQRSPTTDHGALLARAAWPAVREDPLDPRDQTRRLAAEYELVRAAVSALRQIRAEYRVPPDETIEAIVVPVAGSRPVFVTEAEAIGRLARASLRLAGTSTTGAVATALLPNGSTLQVPLADLIDVDRECARLRGELTEAERHLGAVRDRLQNPAFTERANPQVVEGARQQEREWSARMEQLRDKVQSLCRA